MSCPPDLIPEPTPPRPRRGGARPGAGAPTGNLNALKHGRRSRFKDALPLPPRDPTAVARRLLSREQRLAERHAATLMQLALLARYEGECAAAVAEGRPLPHPPLVSNEDVDISGITKYLRRFAERNLRERARRRGLLTLESDSVAANRRFAEDAALLIRMGTFALDRAGHTSLSPADLAALLTPASPNNPTNNQSSSPAPEPTAAVQSTAPNLKSRKENPNGQST